MDVTYRDIPGFPGYRVGDDGSFWTCRISGTSRLAHEWRRSTPHVDKTTGYVRAALSRDGKTILRGVHCLVLEAFVGPCPPGMHGCHFPDPDKTNNRVDNLRWDTPSGNAKDRVIHGTDNRGTKNVHAKLTEADVLEIVELRREIPNATMKEIGMLYGVTLPAISGIFTGTNWSWLTGIKPGTSVGARARRLTELR